MAQFILQGRLKPLFSAGDGILSIGSQIPLRFHNRKFGLHSRNHSTKQVAASPSSRSLSLGKSNIYDSEEASLIVNNNGVNGCGEDTEDEFERDEELTYFRGLVLDISYRPVNVICWKRAICMEFMEKADVLEYYDQIVNSPSGSFYIPAVLRVPHLLQVVKRRRIKNTLSRKNILYRDNFTCQYCSSSENLTIDHILPIALGGTEVGKSVKITLNKRVIKVKWFHQAHCVGHSK